MIARRPAPSDTRFVKLAGPLTAGERYFLCVDSARSISLLYGEFRCNQFVAPRPRPVTPRDTTRRDTTRRDTTRRDTTRSDTTRSDTTRARRDTTLERLLRL